MEDKIKKEIHRLRERANIIEFRLESYYQLPKEEFEELVGRLRALNDLLFLLTG